MEKKTYIFVTDAYVRKIEIKNLVNTAMLRPKWGKIYGGRTHYLPVDMPKKKAAKYMKEIFPNVPQGSIRLYYDAYNIDYINTHPADKAQHNMIIKDCNY